MRRTIVSIILIEFFALALVGVQLQHGLATDEAKYLLSIPYPHPPLLREFFALFSSWSSQEILFRVLLSTALCQSVWFLIPLTKGLPRDRRIGLFLAWLISPALLLQSGTIMLIIPCAIVAFFLVCRVMQGDELSVLEVPLVCILWLLSLFSVYQTVLLTPLVLHLLRRSSMSRRKALILTLFPVIVLLVYTVGHPLILATFFKVSVQDNALSFSDRIAQILTTIIFSGGILTIPGLIGVIASRHRALQVTTVLIIAYIVLTAQLYYAILLTPFCVAGILHSSHRRRIHAPLLIVTHVLTSTLLVWWMFPSLTMAPSRMVMQDLRSLQAHGIVIIDGPFGHDWQYEAGSLSVRAFHDELSKDIEKQATFFICTKRDCSDDIDDTLWSKYRDSAGVGVWQRMGNR